MQKRETELKEQQLKLELEVEKLQLEAEISAANAEEEALAKYVAEKEGLASNISIGHHSGTDSMPVPVSADLNNGPAHIQSSKLNPLATEWDPRATNVQSPIHSSDSVTLLQMQEQMQHQKAALDECLTALKELQSSPTLHLDLKLRSWQTI